MGVFQGFCDVAHQLQALVNGELGATIAQQVVEPLGFGVVVKHQRRPHLGLFVIIDLEDAGVADAFQHFKLASCLTNSGGTRLRAGRVGDGVDANATLNAFNADMLALPVLKAFAFGNQLDELVVANLTMLIGRPDTSLGQATRNGARLLAIDVVRWVRIDAVGEGGNDAVVFQCAGLTTHKSACFGSALQFAFEGGGG